MTKERNVANVPYSRELLNSACNQRAWHWHIVFWSHWREYKTNIGVTNDDSKDSY